MAKTFLNCAIAETYETVYHWNRKDRNNKSIALDQVENY
uniref:Uncharacterized protein n=1 Tax=Arundo donax TaxID=35708 RepID=A0A0A9FT97_ARUDO